MQRDEKAKAALIAAHRLYLQHVPDHTRTRCARCQVPIPCPASLAYVVVMVDYDHIVDDVQRKNAEDGWHACPDWCWPYVY